MAPAMTLAQAHPRRIGREIEHGLRTPLCVLRGYLELLQAGDIAATPQLLAELQAAAQELGDTIDSLLDHPGGQSPMTLTTPPPQPAPAGTVRCSFCGEVSGTPQRRAVTGPGVAICEPCTELAHQVFTENLAAPCASCGTVHTGRCLESMG